MNPMNRQTCPLCYILQSGVNVQDMMTLIRHMLHNGYLVGQTNTKIIIPQEQEKSFTQCITESLASSQI